MIRFFIILLVFLPLSGIWADERIQVREIRYYELSKGFRTVIETNGIVEFTKGQLKKSRKTFL